MKIWFEITNSPHINLFKNIIQELQRENHVKITCRPLANTIELLELNGLQYKIIGSHYGKNFVKKLFGFPIRVLQLVNYIKKYRPDVAIGQSSFQMPLAAKILGIPCVYMNDNEHALGNIPSFIFADRIMIPEFLDRKKVHKQLGRDKKILKYPGLKEGIYLYHLLTKVKKVKKENKVIMFRPEPRTAQYYKGGTNFIDPLLVELKKQYSIIISPRDDLQKNHYKQKIFSDIKVLEKPLNLIEIIQKCDLFIGAGGTMTREMAVSGIPTVSIYQDSLLDVDKYLIREGYLYYKKKPLKKDIDNYISSHANRDNLRDVLLHKGKMAEELIINTIKELGVKK